MGGKKVPQVAARRKRNWFYLEGKREFSIGQLFRVGGAGDRLNTPKKQKKRVSGGSACQPVTWHRKTTRDGRISGFRVRGAYFQKVSKEKNTTAEEIARAGPHPQKTGRAMFILGEY